MPATQARRRRARKGRRPKPPSCCPSRASPAVRSARTRFSRHTIDAHSSIRRLEPGNDFPTCQFDRSINRKAVLIASANPPLTSRPDPGTRGDVHLRTRPWNRMRLQRHAELFCTDWESRRPSFLSPPVVTVYESGGQLFLPRLQPRRECYISGKQLREKHIQGVGGKAQRHWAFRGFRRQKSKADHIVEHPARRPLGQPVMREISPRSNSPRVNAFSSSRPASGFSSWWAAYPPPPGPKLETLLRRVPAWDRRPASEG